MFVLLLLLVVLVFASWQIHREVVRKSDDSRNIWKQTHVTTHSVQADMRMTHSQVTVEMVSKVEHFGPPPTCQP